MRTIVLSALAVLVACAFTMAASDSAPAPRGESASASASASQAIEEPREDLEQTLLLARLDRDCPKLDMDDVPLADAVATISREAKVNIAIAPECLKAAGKVTLQAENLPYSKMLDMLTAQAKLKYRLQNHAVYIYKIEAPVAMDLGPEPANASKAEQALRAKLKKTAPAMNFQDLSLVDIFRFIRDMSEVKISMENENSLTQTVTVSLKDVRLEDAIGLLCQMGGLTCRIVGDSLHVAKPAPTPVSSSSAPRPK